MNIYVTPHRSSALGMFAVAVPFGTARRRAPSPAATTFAARAAAEPQTRRPLSLCPAHKERGSAQLQRHKPLDNKRVHRDYRRVVEKSYKIPNPFVGGEDYNCFACAPDNAIGLGLTFWRHGSEVRAAWEPGDNYQGYTGLVHGGIQATLVDEIGSWTIFALQGAAGLTTAMRIEYLRPLPMDGGAIVVVGKIVKADRKTTTVEATLALEGEEPATRASMDFRILPDALARKRYQFPGAEAFMP